MDARNTERQFIITVFLSIFAVGLNYIISLIITPVITENIGTEAYGFVSLAKTFANYASVFTVALNSFSSRYISIEYHKGNIGEANKYYNSVFIADLAIAFFIFILAFGFILNLDDFLVVPQKLVKDVKKLFLLDIINFLILSCSTVFMTATTIKNRLELGSIAKAISYLGEGLFLFIAFSLLTPRVYLVGIGLVVSSILILVLNVAISSKLTPELKIHRGNFSFLAIKKLLASGIWSSINSLGNMLNTGLDLLISNKMLSAIATGQLAIVKTVSTIFSTLFQLVSSAFNPVLLKHYANGDKKKLVATFKLGIKVNGMLANILFAGFFIFGFVYYSLWTPSQDLTLLQSISSITILGSVIEGAVVPLYYGYNLTIKNKIPCFVTIGAGILNVISKFLLLKFSGSGLFSIVITTVIVTWVVNFVFNPLYVSHCLGLKLTTFYPVLIRDLFSLIVIVIVFYHVSFIFYPTSWSGLIFVAALCALLGSIIHSIIVFDRHDYLIVLKIFKGWNK